MRIQVVRKTVSFVYCCDRIKQSNPDKTKENNQMKKNSQKMMEKQLIIKISNFKKLFTDYYLNARHLLCKGKPINIYQIVKNGQ